MPAGGGALQGERAECDPRARLRQAGSAAPAPQGGDFRSAQIGKHAAFILAQVEAKPDITLREWRLLLRRQGESFGIGTLWRFLDRRRITLKKDGTCC